MPEWKKCENEEPIEGDYSILMFFSKTKSIETVHRDDYFSNITCGVVDGVRQYTKWWKVQSCKPTHWMYLPEPPAEV